MPTAAARKMRVANLLALIFLFVAIPSIAYLYDKEQRADTCERRVSLQEGHNETRATLRDILEQAIASRTAQANDTTNPAVREALLADIAKYKQELEDRLRPLPVEDCG